MDDLRLREMVRPLADKIAPTKSLEAQRRVHEAFRNDGSLHRDLLTEALPLQRLDWIVSPSAAPGVLIPRYPIPEASRAVRISMISTANASSTFEAAVRVNGVERSAISIRVGTDRSGGSDSIDLPAGSVISVQTKNSIAQGVTISVFYRPSER